MNRKGIWVVSGVFLLAVLVIGLSRLSAQFRFPRPDGHASDVGRYTVVLTSRDMIIIMDTTTGDLYKVAPSDIKPYASRPRPRAERDGGKGEYELKDKGPPPPADKDKVPFGDKDKGPPPPPADKDKVPFGDKDKRPIFKN